MEACQGFVLEVKAMDPKSWPAEIEEWLEKVVGGGDHSAP